MFSKGELVNYYYNNLQTLPTNKITIERVVNGKAISTSGSFGDMGPFKMEFDIETGNGVGMYAGACIRPIEH